LIVLPGPVLPYVSWRPRYFSKSSKTCPDRVMICPVPKLRVQMTEQPARGGFPRPPEIEAHLAQRFERRRKNGSYVIRLKSRHAKFATETKPQLIKKSCCGKSVIDGSYSGHRPPATTLGVRISPRKNPAISPHRCAAMLTCGVERSKAI
jgi:hypothetical protein